MSAASSASTDGRVRESNSSLSVERDDRWLLTNSNERDTNRTAASSSTGSDDTADRMDHDNVLDDLDNDLPLDRNLNRTHTLLTYTNNNTGIHPNGKHVRNGAIRHRALTRTMIIHDIPTDDNGDFTSPETETSATYTLSIRANGFNDQHHAVSPPPPPSSLAISGSPDRPFDGALPFNLAGFQLLFSTPSFSGIFSSSPPSFSSFDPSKYIPSRFLWKQTPHEEMAARCETVLNTTMAEMDTYHTQKVEDFTTLAKEHLDGEIKFYEQVCFLAHFTSFPPG